MKAWVAEETPRKGRIASSKKKSAEEKEPSPNTHDCSRREGEKYNFTRGEISGRETKLATDPPGTKRRGEGGLEVDTLFGGKRGRVNGGERKKREGKVTFLETQGRAKQKKISLQGRGSYL